MRYHNNKYRIKRSKQQQQINNMYKHYDVVRNRKTGMVEWPSYI